MLTQTYEKLFNMECGMKIKEIAYTFQYFTRAVAVPLENSIEIGPVDLYGGGR